jgi:hypothetical protein
MVKHNVTGQNIWLLRRILDLQVSSLMRQNSEREIAIYFEVLQGLSLFLPPKGMIGALN